ncbi:hypothetical protein LPN04_03760 [Rugamonas sp. A1-17]|nr:hypothetical protein [Rugamonas sp. A1-17]
MNPHEQHLRNDLDGLQLVNKFGWLRPHELGPLLWPNSQHARHQADRLVRCWRKRRLILERPLPGRAGRAVVLSAAGVRFLTAHDVQAVTGKDFGETHGNVWSPPLTWRHDLIAVGVLVNLYLQGFDIFPEAQIKRSSGQLKKLPDGIARRGEQVISIEVEHARKTGPSMRNLALALCSAAQGTTPPIFGMRITHAMVAFVSTQIDERGYTLSHRERVTKAIAESAKSAVPITWASCSMRSAGVRTVQYTDDLIEADRAAAVLHRLELCGWRPEAGALLSNYKGRVAAVWEDEEADAWGWQIDDLPAERVSTISEAKRRCAEVLATP